MNIVKSPRAKKRAAKWRLAQMIKRERGCIDCGYNEHPVALQFDHVGDDKKGNVSNLIRSDYSWKTILKEIDKCEVRCANCHAVVTARRKSSYRGSAPSVPDSVSSKTEDPHEDSDSLLIEDDFDSLIPVSHRRGVHYPFGLPTTAP